VPATSPTLLLGRVAACLSGAFARAVFSLPSPVLRRLAGTPPPHAAGLHPEAWLLARLSAITPSRQSDDVPVAEQRRRLALSAAPLALHPRLPLTVRDHAIPGVGGGAPIPARLYVPDGAPAGGALLVYFHGGGWVQGSVATHDPACRLLAHLSGVRVLSVDYRLAPEHPYPAAADDAIAAYAWAASEGERLGIDPARIAVGGDSAGGNLAAVVALAARDDVALPAAAFQLLIYPAVDLAGKAESVTTFASGFLLTEAGMDWYVDKYVPDPGRREEPRASPLRAADLSGLPPAYVATCIPDPLRDEGEAYAARLREAGVAVTLQRHDQLHGFVNTSAIPSSGRALAGIAGAHAPGLGGARTATTPASPSASVV
jgi:acetyl esterase